MSILSSSYNGCITDSIRFLGNPQWVKRIVIFYKEERAMKDGKSIGSTMEKGLERLAEQILSFDEASLVHLREKYRARIEHFDGTKDWEKAVIIFCIINAVSMKNSLFNENVLKRTKTKAERSSPQGQGRPGLKRVK
jgi:hypothetical protein